MHRTALVRFAETVNMDRWLTGKVKSHKAHSLYDKDANNCNWQAFESQHTQLKHYTLHPHRTENSVRAV